MSNNNVTTEFKSFNSLSGVNFELYNNGQKTSDKVLAVSYSVSRDCIPYHTQWLEGPVGYSLGKWKTTGTIIFFDTPTVDDFDELRLVAKNNEHTIKATLSIPNVSLIETTNKEHFSFVASPVSAWKLEYIIENISDICDCGAAKCGFTTHSSWCSANGNVKL